MRAPRLLGSLAAAATAAGVLAACGSSSSASKPAYCADRSALEQSVSDLKNVDLASGGLSAVQTQLSKVDADAKALAGSAKADFPQQTSAISSSVSALDTSVKSLGSSPSAQDLLGLGQGIAGVVTASKGFSDATAGKC
jgi:hypothetical protein